MHLDIGNLEDSDINLDTDTDLYSDSDSDSDSDSNPDLHLESDDDLFNFDMNYDLSAPGSSKEVLILNKDAEEEEEDTIEQAIIRSSKLNRSHPPTIITDNFITDICFHPQEDLIAVATMGGDVLLYKYCNVETVLVSSIEIHLQACRNIEFNFDGKIIFSTSKDLSIMMTDVETEKFVRFYKNAHKYPVHAMTILSEHTFATGDDIGVVKLWDIRQKGENPVFSIQKMDSYVSDIISNRDNKYLVCASGDGLLTTFNIREKRFHIQTEDYDEELLCLGLFKSETKILSATSEGNMYVFNWGEFGLHSDKFPTLNNKSLNHMIPITENIVITGGEEGLIRATSLFPHHHLGVVGHHEFPIEALDVNKDGKLIASSSHNNDIKFWNVEYLETLNVSDVARGGKQKQMRHNLPSSQINNASDFFADL